MCRKDARPFYSGVRPVKKRRQFYQSVSMTVEDGKASNTTAKTSATIAVRPKSAKKLQAVSPIRERSRPGQPADNEDISRERDKDGGPEDQHASGVSEE
jgi:hypothetical protein